MIQLMQVSSKMEANTTYPCPCGQTSLTIQETRKLGPNHKRKYLTHNCGFYSFVDELKWCKCGRGYCRNKFKGKKKYWCCAMKGRNACSFEKLVEQNLSTSSSSHSSTGATPDHPAPSHSSAGTPPNSSTPTRTEENLSEALAMSQGAIGTLVDIVKDLVKLSLNNV